MQLLLIPSFNEMDEEEEKQEPFWDQAAAVGNPLADEEKMD